MKERGKKKRCALVERRIVYDCVGGRKIYWQEGNIYLADHFGGVYPTGSKGTTNQGEKRFPIISRGLYLETIRFRPFYLFFCLTLHPQIKKIYIIPFPTIHTKKEKTEVYKRSEEERLAMFGKAWQFGNASFFIYFASNIAGAGIELVKEKLYKGDRSCESICTRPLRDHPTY